jgi:hypothetical protein
LPGFACALAFGISVIEAVIESIKNIAIVIAKILFLAIFIFHFSFLWTLSQPTLLQAVSSASQRALWALTHLASSHHVLDGEARIHAIRQ